MLLYDFALRIVQFSTHLPSLLVIIALLATVTVPLQSLPIIQVITN
jgi:hypothetical protein